jgi:peptidyl-prolyl cis-trans isomerase D
MFRWKKHGTRNLSKAHILRNVGSYGILGLALLAMTFFGVCDPGSMQSNLPSGTAAVVGPERISASEFKRFYSSTLERFRSSQPDFDAAKFGLSRRVMDYLVSERATFVLAQELGLKASRKEVENVILAQAERFKDQEGKFSKELFQRWLKYNGHTEASFITEQQRAMTNQKLAEVVDRSMFVSSQAVASELVASETKFNINFVKISSNNLPITISDKELADFIKKDEKGEVKKYFDEHPREFNTSAEVKARHILIAFKGARNAGPQAAKRSKEMARKKAETLLLKVRAPKTKFSQIASKETDEPSGKTKGGDLGWFKREVMVKEFSDVAFKLKKGEISEIVESPFGFHIIKAEDLKAATSTTLEQATPSIAKQILQKAKAPELLQKKAKDALATLQKGQNVSKFGKWESTGEFAAIARSIPKMGSDSALRQAILSLSKNGDIYNAPIKVGSNYYVIQLKSLRTAKPSSFTSEQREQMAKSDAYALARNVINTAKANSRQGMDDKGAVWTNEEYSRWDEQKGAQPR